MSMLVQARGRCLPKEKESKSMAKARSLSGDPHVMITGSQMVALKVINARSIIQGDSQEDARSVDPLVISPRNVLAL